MVGVAFHHRVGTPVAVCQHRVASAQDSSRGAQDLRRAAVVLAQAQYRRPGKVDREPAQVVGVGAVPPVDGLVGITHHTEVRSTVQPGVEKLELERVHVLELVHVQVAEPPPLGIGKSLVSG